MEERITKAIADVLVQMERRVAGLEKELQAARKEQESTRKEQERTRKELEATRKKLEDTREELENTRGALGSAQDELQSARKEIRSACQELEKITSAPASYASALRSPSSAATRPSITSFPTTSSISPGSSASRPAVTSLPGLDLDLAKVAIQGFNKTNAGGILTRVDEALSKLPATQDVRSVGITMNTKDKDRIRVLFRSERDAETARANDSWIQAHFQGARLRGEQWYPIKVDRVLKASLFQGDLTEATQETCQTVGQENQASIARIRLLSKPGPKEYGSAVFFLTRKQDMERLLTTGLLDVRGETAFPKEYERKPTPTRCFRCQQYGHLQFRCPAAEEVCAKCAAKGHREDGCTATTTKCPACSGPHKATDRGCPKYIEQLNRLNPVSHV
jgi:hypothetical protein